MATGVEQELTLPRGALRLVVSSATDLGNVRKVNEDSFLADSVMFIVADGMGGHSFGDRASQSVVATFAAAIGAGSPLSPEVIVQTIHEANHTVVAMSEGENGTVSGTTLAGVALVAVGSEPVHHWMAFNVGDSRVYSWDGRRLEQVTVDHSAVQELLDLGRISPLEAIEHPHRNVVTRAMGVYEAVEPDIWLLPVGGQQTFIVCSDGLTKELADDLIAGILANRGLLADGQSLADRLVEAALAAGGRDNVTVVVIESELVENELVGCASSSSSEETSDRNIADVEETRPRK